MKCYREVILRAHNCRVQPELRVALPSLVAASTQGYAEDRRNWNSWLPLIDSGQSIENSIAMLGVVWEFRPGLACSVSPFIFTSWEEAGQSHGTRTPRPLTKRERKILQRTPCRRMEDDNDEVIGIPTLWKACRSETMKEYRPHVRMALNPSSVPIKPRAQCVTRDPALYH